MRRIRLPFPPSVNHYWVRTRFGSLAVGKRGKQFRQEVIELLDSNTKTLEGRLEVEIDVYPPDRRKRDLDNLLKATLDALCHAGLYSDDSQIDILKVNRKEIEKGGKICVTVQEIDNG